ncbi:MAG: hypothetical protein LQ345_004160 [Seirophora villosa]|nr:MAG: hypothetical protein LQ345_004160 [Seirophora villosa]
MAPGRKEPIVENVTQRLRQELTGASGPAALVKNMKDSQRMRDINREIGLDDTLRDLGVGDDNNRSDSSGDEKLGGSEGKIEEIERKS